MNTPIVGDVKYGGERAVSLGLANAKKMHLHARAISIPHPNGSILRITADLPPHIKQTFDFLGFVESESVNAFDYFKKDE